MIRIEEILTIITEAGMAALEQRKHHLVGVGLGGPAHFIHHRAINAHAVVFNVRALDAHGHFKQLVVD